MVEKATGTWLYSLADLHVHTVLSACAGVEMIPPLIVGRARELGLEIVAITDHNAAHNVAAVIEAAAGSGITVLPGMEVQSREEVHLICLFDRLEQVLGWQERVFDALPNRKNDASFFGAQFVVDASGGYLYTEERLLAVSAALSVEEVVGGVRALGGIVLAAHVDRPSFSLIANLGFVPPGLAISGLELSRGADPARVSQRVPQAVGWRWIVSGDAHRLEEMTARTMFKIASPTVAEMEMAMAGRDGRRVEIVDGDRHLERDCQEELHGRRNP
jgi:PHP family Zn ribbon phosphoesterase